VGPLGLSSASPGQERSSCNCRGRWACGGCVTAVLRPAPS